MLRKRFGVTGKKNMLSFTLDTNTLVSATISHGNEYELLKFARGWKIRLFLSLEIINEFKEVISRPKFGFSEQQVDDVVKQLINLSEIIITWVVINEIKEDPDDNMVLECAVSCKAKYIVSGDSHLLKLKEFREIEILSAKGFLEVLD